MGSDPTWLTIINRCGERERDVGIYELVYREFLFV